MRPNDLSQAPVLSTGGRFLDAQGRELLLHGTNLVNKHPDQGPQDGDRPETFAAMRRWGFNCVRLGVIWEALEPQAGQISEAYLRRIEQQVAWAAENNLYVILDMHQDLYSALYSDGAPAWATLSGGAPHIVQGGVWSDAYFTSPAVQTALDHFWQNAPAPDGVGLQEHLAACWRALAQRTHGAGGGGNVIGYDLYNEPFPGSAALPSQMMLFERGAELLAEIDPSRSFSAEELAMEWLDPDGRSRILAQLEDGGLFARIIDVTQPVYAEFERSQLMPFYRRIANAIRAVDPERILFLETSMGSNMGVTSAVEALSSGGRADPAQAYAPHGYDLLVDTPHLAQSSSARVELIFQRHGETARRLGLPMLVGEWGAFDRSIPGTLPAARWVSRQFEQLLCSDTYWHFEADLDDLPAFQALSRPYPERVAGRLISYHYSSENDDFECTWEEDPATGAPTMVYLPAWFRPLAREIQLDPPGSGFQVSEGQGGVWLSIPAGLRAGRRSLKTGQG